MKKSLWVVAIGALGLGTVAVVAGQSSAEPRCHRVHYPARVHADHFSGMDSR